MSKSNSLERDWARAPPPSGPLCRRLANVVYNPEEKSFLGRTPRRWGIVLTFYMVFYAVLALMFAACMGGLFLTLDPKTPSYILSNSLIGNNPGVSFRPRPLDGAVVKCDASNSTASNEYIKELNEFLTPYHNVSVYSDKECTYKNDSYGYPNTPCFFIKLNKIIGWTPEFYDTADLPSDMPDDLKEYIESEQVKQQIWISCQQEGGNTTSMTYPWGRGLPADHYPYLNTDGYLSPLVAVKVTLPVNSLVVIRCRAWAKNVIYNKSQKEPSGYTRFQVHMVNHTTTTKE